MSDWEADSADENRVRDSYKARFEAEAAKRREEEAQRDAQPLLPEEKELAIVLHSVLCRWNHIDGCTWQDKEISDHEWNRDYAHVDYIRKARFLIAQDGAPEEMIKTLRLVQAAKAV